MRDATLLWIALDVARDGLIHAADLDWQTVAALNCWLTPHGPADAPYWPEADVEAVLDGGEDDKTDVTELTIDSLRNLLPGAVELPGAATPWTQKVES